MAVMKASIKIKWVSKNWSKEAFFYYKNTQSKSKLNFIQFVRMNENDPFEEYFSGEGCWVKCEREFRRFISINPHSLRTRNNLKSMTVIKAETLRHLLFYRNKIHSFSRFRWVIKIMFEVISLWNLIWNLKNFSFNSQ